MADYIDKFKDVNEIKECAKYYIQLLGLQDWRIVYKHGVPSNEDWAGECESQFQEKCAKITIDNRTFDDMWFKQPQELTLIHELIHCKIPMVDNGHMEGSITEIFYHQLVDDWARSIFYTRYGLTHEDMYFKESNDANNNLSTKTYTSNI